MKLDLSLNGEKFKEEVKNLRRELSEIKEKGNTDTNFEIKLNRLLAKENRLLTEMIPYVRSLNKFKSGMNISQFKNSGPYEFKGFLRKYEKIGNSLYIISNDERKTYLLNIDEDRLYFSEEIKSLSNKKTSEIINVEGSIYVFTNKGEIQILRREEGKKLRHIRTLSSEIPWDRAVHLYENVFLASRDERIYMLKIGEKAEISRNSINIENLADYTALKDNMTAVITEDGFLYILKYTEYSIEIKNKIYLDASLVKIKILEGENSDRKSMAIISNDGILFIISLENFEILNKFNLEGNLFRIGSSQGTAVILSDSGTIYLLEENLSEWKIGASFKNSEFYTDVIERDKKHYIVANLDGDFHSLNIERITEAGDLENIALY